MGSAAIGAWAGEEQKAGGHRHTNPNKSEALLRLERRLELREKAAKEGNVASAPELTANIRRKIQFLEDCDR